MKPEGYPLPWCDALDAPYWAINMDFILGLSGWLDWQSGKPMSEIIPKIDELLEKQS